jgi:hypothetical protein
MDVTKAPLTTQTALRHSHTPRCCIGLKGFCGGWEAVHMHLVAIDRENARALTREKKRRA